MRARSSSSSLFAGAPRRNAPRGSCGPRSSSSCRRHRPCVDEDATQQRMHSLLQSKSPFLDDHLLLEKETGIISSAKQVFKAPRTRPRVKRNAFYDFNAVNELDVESEKEAFMRQVCSESTRLDVREWVGKIFDMLQDPKLTTKIKQLGESTAHQQQPGDAATSDSGRSDPARGSATVTSSDTAGLVAPGGNINVSRFRAPSQFQTNVSTATHGAPLLSATELLHAFLEGRFPQLEAHVNKKVAASSEALQRDIDREVMDQFLWEAGYKNVFGRETNYNRWKAVRRQMLQARLNTNVPTWILEAFQSWDQRRDLDEREQRRKKDLDSRDTDFVYEYLTKRAAHIQKGELPTEIPVMPTLHMSYSLPSMWRDR